MQQTSTKCVQDYTRLGGKGDPSGIVQEIEIWTYEHMVYAQPRMGFTEFSGILRYKRMT